MATENMSNPRISNEVLSDQISAMGTQLVKLDAKFDMTVSKFVTREIHNLELQSLRDEIIAIKSAASRRLNWIVPSVLYVMGQLLLYVLIKKTGG